MQLGLAARFKDGVITSHKNLFETQSIGGSFVLPHIYLSSDTV